MEKKKGNVFLKILVVFFILYVLVFILNKTGYYTKRITEKTEFTKEQIEIFEDDVENNKATDVISYLPEEKDYSNFLTRSVNNFANSLGNSIDNNFGEFFNFIKSLFIN